MSIKCTCNLSANCSCRISITKEIYACYNCILKAHAPVAAVQRQRQTNPLMTLILSIPFWIGPVPVCFCRIVTLALKHLQDLSVAILAKCFDETVTCFEKKLLHRRAVYFQWLALAASLWDWDFTNFAFFHVLSLKGTTDHKNKEACTVLWFWARVGCKGTSMA